MQADDPLEMLFLDVSRSHDAPVVIDQPPPIAGSASAIGHHGQQYNVSEPNQPSARVARLRKQRREAMKRWRQGKRVRVQAMTEHESHLRRRMAVAIAQLSPATNAERLRLGFDALLPQDFRRLPMSERRQALINQVLARQALLSERDVLLSNLRRHEKWHVVLRQHEETAALDLDTAATDVPSLSISNNSYDSSSSSSSGGQWVQFGDDTMPSFCNPEAHEIVNESIITAFHRVHRLRAAFDSRRVVPMAETTWLGWRLQYSLSPADERRATLRLRFFRRLPRHRTSIDEVHKASWRLLSCEQQNTRLYRSRVFAKIVQHVGDDTFVFLRNAPDKHRRLNVRYFSLTTQMEFRTDANERGILTLMSCLDKEPLVNGAEHATPPVVWLKDGCEYIALTESTRRSDETEDMVEIEFGASIRCESEEQARFLLVEMPGILMRWERLVLPAPPLAF
ncbi:hypothetical protein PINS_up011303 [Pythium insidiosum]|nr:hypothetical protein PINS_up011303 [Pythium insidiosum]